MKLKLHVNEEAILNGLMGDGGHCPIALTIKPLFSSCCVGKDLITAVSYKDGKTLYWVMPLPDVAIDFIACFDNRKKVKPIDFEIEVPDDVIDAINIDDILQPLTFKSKEPCELELA